MGKRRSIAAIDATREITPAVLGSTGVLIFAFMPLLFLPEGAGKFTQSFIYTIIFTVFASLVISLTIIPFLASRILSRDEDAEGNAILRWLTHQIERLYRPILHRALDMPRRTLWASMALTLSAFALIPVLGFSLFPYADTSYFRVTVEAEQGSGVADHRCAGAQGRSGAGARAGHQGARRQHRQRQPAGVLQRLRARPAAQFR